MLFAFKPAALIILAQRAVRAEAAAQWPLPRSVFFLLFFFIFFI